MRLIGEIIKEPSEKEGNKSKKREFAQTEKTLNDQIMQQSIDLRSLRGDSAVDSEKENPKRKKILNVELQIERPFKKGI